MVYRHFKGIHKSYSNLVKFKYSSGLASYQVLTLVKFLQQTVVY